MIEQLLNPYLLGCLLGDGGLHGNLTFANLDLDILERVNTELNKYSYQLVKRSNDPKRSSEYSIRPIQNNKIKYNFYYQDTKYTASELLIILQKQGYNITSHDTLLSIVGESTKTKKSNILKYYPELQDKIICKKIKDSQHSLFIDLLNKFNLRCRFDEKRIPTVYFNLSMPERLELFQGLMDTDGAISSGKRLEFCVANKLLAEDFAHLAQTLGYSPKIYEKQPKYFNKKYNEVRFGHKAYRVVLNYQINIQPFLCKRKLNKYKEEVVK